MMIGDRLKLAREAAGLTQSAVARKAKVTPSAISQIESGLSKKPSAENLLPIAKALGVHPEWLITGKGSMRSRSVIQKRIADMMQRNHMVPEDLDMLTRGNVTTATIERWLDGSADPTDAELKAVAPHLGMPADYFRTGVSAVKYPGGGDRSVIEMPEGYDQASPEARSLAETIIRMSAAGELDEKRLTAISELLGVRRQSIDPAFIEHAAMEALHRQEQRTGRKLAGKERDDQLNDLRESIASASIRHGKGARASSGQGGKEGEKGGADDRGASGTNKGH